MESNSIMEWSNRKIFTSLTLTLALVCAICIYSRNLQENYDKNVSWERCSAELKSARHQLEVVMEYKDRADKLLAETQRYHDTDKDRFKGVMESCFAMTHQSIACHNQLDALKLKYQKTRLECVKIVKELGQLKNHKNSTQMT